MPGERPISSLVLAELYDSGNASFIDLLLRRKSNLKPYVGLIEKWKKDKRAWARRLKLDFVLRRDLGPEARLIFKRLFKQAWADRDHELMGACMVASDCMLRRKRVKQYRYVNRQVEFTETLKLPQRRPRLFSGSTTHYLRRRAWRYFRRLGFSAPDQYVPAVAEALVRYTDNDMRMGENLLDNWALMHACFGKSPAIVFNARHTNLSTESGLSQLSAAPMFERLWAKPESMPALLDVLLRAQCRPVRIWAIQLLRRLHESSLARIDGAMLLKLIDHTDADVAAFAADLLGNAQTVSSFPMTTWMDLLATRSPTVVAVIVEAFRKHVSFDRLTNAQAIELTTRIAVPVARLGLEVLGGKTLRSDTDLHALAKLAGAQCSAVAAEIARFALSRLNVPRVYDLAEIIAFFDSRILTMRQGAFVALTGQTPADTDPAFWARLFESPYDDVRIEFVAGLKARGDLPGASAHNLALLWQRVLLNIHRGGRAKLSALRQISDRITAQPQTASTLLPVLAVAIRSVRAPEARHGLAAVISAVEAIPSLADSVRQYLPELQLDLAGAAR